MGEPIVRQLKVRCSVEHAFKVFTERLDMWWPPGHRLLPKQPSRLTLEGRVGGQFYEKDAAGNVKPFGHVLIWEPPSRLAYAWYLGTSAQLPTEVTVRFKPEGEHTLVEMVHRESKSLGGAWPQKAKFYARAWDNVLKAYGQALDAEHGVTT